MLVRCSSTSNWSFVSVNLLRSLFLKKMKVEGCSLIAQAHKTRINTVSEFTEATMKFRLNTEKMFTMKKIYLDY
jgi:hypothetical protein